MKVTNEELMLARLAVGFHGPLRYYRTLESLGMDWAAPVREAIQKRHDEAMKAIDEAVAQ